MSRVKTILINTILICSFLICGHSSYSQSIELAHNYYKQESFDAALKEYLKVYYFDAYQAEDLVPMRIAELFLMRKDIAEAIKYYDIQYFALGYNDPARNGIRYEKIKAFLVNQQYQKAKIEVLQINAKLEESKDKLNFYKGLIYYFNNDYPQGLKYLNKLTYLSYDDKVRLNKLCRKLAKNAKRKSTAYQIASGVIPGLGQYFAGDIKGGLNSTLLNGGLVYLFFSVAERLSYQDALLTVSPWIMRYFIGGVGNAKKAAESKKGKIKSKFMTESISIIQKAQQPTSSISQE